MTPIIFGEMSSADFYPEGREDEIDIIISAPKNTKITAGKVVIMDIETYSKLTKENEVYKHALIQIRDSGRITNDATKIQT